MGTLPMTNPGFPSMEIRRRVVLATSNCELGRAVCYYAVNIIFKSDILERIYIYTNIKLATEQIYWGVRTNYTENYTILGVRII